MNNFRRGHAIYRQIPFKRFIEPVKVKVNNNLAAADYNRRLNIFARARLKELNKIAEGISKIVYYSLRWFLK